MAEETTQARPRPFITSVDVRTSGARHEYVSVWIRGQNVGTLCVGAGDGEPLKAVLLGEPIYVRVEVPAQQFGENNAFKPSAAEMPAGVEVRAATDDEQRQALDDALRSRGINPDEDFSGRSFGFREMTPDEWREELAKLAQLAQPQGWSQLEVERYCGGDQPGQVHPAPKSESACTDDPELLAERYPGRDPEVQR